VQVTLVEGQNERVCAISWGDIPTLGAPIVMPCRISNVIIRLREDFKMENHLPIVG